MLKCAEVPTVILVPRSHVIVRKRKTPPRGYGSRAAGSISAKDYFFLKCSVGTKSTDGDGGANVPYGAYRIVEPPDLLTSGWKS